MAELKPCTLEIRDLELCVYLGWPQAERQHRQVVLLNACIAMEQPPLACKSDDLNDTFCYSKLMQALRTKVQQENYQLIEHMGAEIYQFIKAAAPIGSKVQVSITKFPHIEGLKGGVSFSYGDQF